MLILAIKFVLLSQQLLQLQNESQVHFEGKKWEKHNTTMPATSEGQEVPDNLHPHPMIEPWDEHPWG